MGISDTCKTNYRAAHDSGTRKTSDIKYVVIHATEGATAAGAASWFQNQASGGSANLVVDDKECYKTVPDTVTPWGAPPLNASGFHIEQAGYSGWSKVKWMLHLNTIRRCAYKTAQRCKEYNIPLQWLSVADLKAGKKGITSHNNVSLAFGQSNHTDPGTAYPYSTFLWLVKYYHKSL
jgi:hypothetical protein